MGGREVKGGHTLWLLALGRAELEGVGGGLPLEAAGALSHLPCLLSFRHATIELEHARFSGLFWVPRFRSFLLPLRLG